MTQDQPTQTRKDPNAQDPQAGRDTEAEHGAMPQPDHAQPEPAHGDAPPPDAPAEVSSERVVEAILFAVDSPIPPAKIVSVLGTGSVREVRKIVQSLNDTYTQGSHAFRIAEIAGGYQMLTLPEYNSWLRRLKQTRQESKLSPAALETLAIIAYKQPVVRADIEAIRGVSVGEVLNRLRELALVKVVGRADDVGRPMLYGTTRHFLETFGLSSLDDLPAVEELQMPE
jgi:segregation and condensation protein B